MKPAFVKSLIESLSVGYVPCLGFSVVNIACSDRNCCSLCARVSKIRVFRMGSREPVMKSAASYVAIHKLSKYHFTQEDHVLHSSKVRALDDEEPSVIRRSTYPITHE